MEILAIVYLFHKKFQYTTLKVVFRKYTVRLFGLTLIVFCLHVFGLETLSETSTPEAKSGQSA